MATLIEKLFEVISDIRYKKGVEKAPVSIIHVKNPSEKLILSALKADSTIFPNLRSDNITQKTYDMAVQLQGNNLRFVPDEYKTEQMCKDAVKKDGTLLDFVPEKLQTTEICIAALENDINAFPYIRINDEQVNIAAINIDPALILKMKDPSENIILGAAWLWPEVLKHFNLNKESYEQLVDLEKSNIRLIPEKYRSIQMCIAAYAENKSHIVAFPKQFQTEELWVEAIKETPNLIKEIEQPTREMIVTALQQNGLLLSEIYPEMKRDISSSQSPDYSSLNEVLQKRHYASINKEIADKYNLTPILKRIDVLGDQISEEMRGDNFSTANSYRLKIMGEDECLAYIAIRECAKIQESLIQEGKIQAIQVPYIQDPEYCKIAVLQNPLAIQYVYNPSNDLYSEMTNKHPRSILCLPEPSNEMANRAALRVPSIIPHLPGKINIDTYKQLINRQTDNVQYIPEQEQTPELCKLVIEKSNGNDYQYIAPANMTDELWSATLKLNFDAFKDAPISVLSPELFPHFSEEQEDKLQRLVGGEAFASVFKEASPEQKESFCNVLSRKHRSLFKDVEGAIQSIESSPNIESRRYAQNYANTYEASFRDEMKMFDNLRYEAKINYNRSLLSPEQLKDFERILQGEEPHKILKNYSSEAAEAFIEKIDYNGNLSEAIAWHQASQKSMKEGDYGLADQYRANYCHFTSNFISENNARLSTNFQQNEISQSVSRMNYQEPQISM